MEDVFEKKIKEFLPYLIIIAVVYLFLPSLIVFTNSNGVLNQIVYMGAFPITAFACNLVFAYKKRNDFFMSLVAPIIYIPSMLLYGNIRDSVVNSLIYLVSYFICSYLGLVIGEMVAGKETDNAKKDASRTPNQRRRVPKKINPQIEDVASQEITMDDIKPVESFYDDAHDDDSADEVSDYADTTDDDINAILDEIHNRH